MAHEVSVLVGPARCGKTHLLVNQYRQVLLTAGARPGRALWLAPSARSMASVRQQLMNGTLSACLGPGVLTFDILADRVLASAANPPRTIPPLVERMLLRRVIAEALKKQRLPYLAETARRMSFVDLLGEHFRELKRRGIAPADFARLAGARGDRAQHEELAQLYLDYQNLLDSQRLCDTEGRHIAARETLTSDAALFADLQLVVVDGFTDFTRVQLDTLDQLAQRTNRLVVALPGDANLRLVSEEGEVRGAASGRDELFAKTAATLAELRRRHPKMRVERLPCRETAWPALDHIAEHIFRHPRDIPSPSQAAADSLSRLQIVAAAGSQDEIVQIARSIKQQLIDNRRSADKVCGPGDIVVVFRNLREAAPRVRAVFEEFGIPYSIEAGMPLATAGVVKTLLALLRLDAEDWPFRRVVSVVTNNLLTTFDRRERAAAEWLVRDLQIAHGRDALLIRVQHLASESTPASGEPSIHPARTHRGRRAQSAVAAAALLERLATALDELPSEATPSAWIAAFTELGRRLGIGCLAAATNEPIDDSQSRAAWLEIAAHFAALEQAAHQLGEPMPRLSRGDILDLLIDLAKHESLRRPFDDAGRVRVLSAATARMVEAKHLYLAGMSEQAFPSPERPGRLYSDADYRCFANAADDTRGKAELPSVQRSQEEMLLFYEVLTRAGERLTISYPSLDEKAQALPPSPYVTEVERSVEPEKIVRQHASRPSPLPGGTTPLGPADWRIQAVHQALAADGNLSLLAGYFHGGDTVPASALEAALRTTHARSRRDAFGTAEGLLESDAIRQQLAKRFGGEHLWSPSQWENYALCPYRFYLEDVLGLEPLGELVLETDHRRRGSLVHRALADFHRRAPELLGRQSRLSQHDAERFVKEFENVLEALVRATPYQGVEAALVELDRRQIGKWAPRYHTEHGKYDDRWATLDEPLAPTYLEWRFGPPRSDESEYEDPRSTAEPFLLNLGKEQVRITGRVDRIDVGRSGEQIVFSVIDYKSGRRPSLSREKIVSGEHLQPALYVMAAQALLFGDDQATPLYAGYWSMTNGVSVEARYSLHCSEDHVSPSVQWRSLRDEVVEQIGRFVGDIRRGNFPVASRDDNCTSRCSFATVCRVGQVRSLGKQWFPNESDE